MQPLLLLMVLLGAAPQSPAASSPRDEAPAVRPAARPSPPPGRPQRSNEISQAESCALRMAARCAVARKCPGRVGDQALFIHEEHQGEVNTYLPCARIAEICAALPGKAPYPRREVERCAEATAARECTGFQDEPRQLRTLVNPEHRAPECAGLLLQDAARPPWIHASPEQTVGLIEQHIGCTRGEKLLRNDPAPSMSAVQRAEEARPAPKR